MPYNWEVNYGYVATSSHHHNNNCPKSFSFREPNIGEKELFLIKFLSKWFVYHLPRIYSFMLKNKIELFFDALCGQFIALEEQFLSMISSLLQNMMSSFT